MKKLIVFAIKKICKYFENANYKNNVKHKTELRKEKNKG